uniref:NACHT domain-containing protein n=1 Tax=Bionectria ochroleuca TaxID=29856 RepID=A0A8H7NAA2_BIOOC
MTAIVVLVTTTLIRRSSGQPLELPRNEKSLTLRVDDIPADRRHILDHNPKSIFDQAPNLRVDADKVVCRSLVPYGNDYLCATISIITSLSADDLSAELGRAGNGHPYSFSCKFEGITPLHEDENGVDVDIIAVPGLAGHALGSWKSPNSDDVWLRDFLPKDVPNIRVLLYGYDTTLPGSLSKQSIEDLGGALLEQINAYRARDETSHRPIIFIGHSLGGLLIKEALVRARRRCSDANSILSNASYGILFFGVPNLGLRNDQLRTLVRGQPNEALIHDLLVDKDSEPSTFMKRLADQFSETCKGQYRVVTFFERVLSPALEVDQDGKWRRSGPVALLVTEKSATNTGLVAVADEDNIPLNRDHSGLVKYSSRSQGDYTVVRERLRRLVDEAKHKFATRVAEHKTTQACLRSLAFDDMDGRQYKIDAAAKDTCKWLLSHETLMQWTRQYRGLLWIKGKPGSGKSTLLKFALREVPAHYGADTLAFSFFFHGRGHELQRTPLGLFRSIVHQLLSRVPSALHDLIDEFEAKRKSVGEPGEKWQWHLQQLQAFLASSLPRILEMFPVVVFIDALDECGEQPAVELIGYLKDLILGLPPTNSRFGIFFSCRHYPIVELNSGSTILLDTENKSDITTYIQTRLSGDYIDAEIQSIISKSAQGVFMWAHLVVERADPQTLDDLYHGLIQDVENRSDTLRLMQWICFSRRPLKTDELQWAMAVQPDRTHKSLEECQNSEDFIADENVDRRIKTLSCGLAEIVPSTNAPVVQFIHQSVKDYFVERGLLLLYQTGPPELFGPAAHCSLSRSCIRYLKMAVLSHSGPFRRKDQSRFPLLHYATTSWVSHIKLGEPAETASSGLLDLLGWSEDSLVELWVRTYEQMEPYANDRPRSGTKLIHVVSRYGLTKLASCLLQDCGEIDALVNVQDSWGRTPLWWAAWNGHKAVVNLLLDTGKVDINARDENGTSPLSWAAGNRHEAMAKILLDTGKVDVNSRDENGISPLSWAAGNGHEVMAKMLLDTDEIDIDLRDKNGRSPLSWAAGKGHKAMAKMLLDTGKVDIDARDNRSRTPLLWAARNGHKAMAEMLLDTGKVDVDSKAKDGRTPLSCAAENGHEAVVKLLLVTGKVDVDLKDKDGRTPLLWAVNNTYPNMMSLHQMRPQYRTWNNGALYDYQMQLLLLEQQHKCRLMKARQDNIAAILDTGKVDIKATDKNSISPSWRAAGNRREAVVKLLLNTGKVDINARDENGTSPLSWAAGNGHEVMARMLLDTGKVDINLRDKNSRSPLWWAAENGHEAVAKMLLDTGKVDVDLKAKDGRTPLLCTAENGHEAVVKLLLATGKVDVDARDNGGRTPLLWAALYGREAVVKLLLDISKVDVDARDNGGRTPLSRAAENGHKAVVKLLLATGKVNIDARDNRARTPLSWAAENRHEAVVKLLLNIDKAVVKLLLDTGKVDINAKDKEGWTPLSWAAENGHEDVVRLLLNIDKVDVDAEDSYGLTAYQLSVFNNHEQVIVLRSCNLRIIYAHQPSIGCRRFRASRKGMVQDRDQTHQF